MDGRYDNGYASYKVAAPVTSHEAWALGAYAFFNQAPVVLDNAIEVPANVAGIKMHNLCTVTLGGNQGTVTHIINGTGRAVNPIRPGGAGHELSVAGVCRSSSTAAAAAGTMREGERCRAITACSPSSPLRGPFRRSRQRWSQAR